MKPEAYALASAVAPSRPSTPPAAVSATTNPCSACAPLGAVLAFRGIDRCLPLLHGAQGCATYIRRHLIGHFREPMDTASSGLDERSAIFGGEERIRAAADRVVQEHAPELLGIASTCLAETMGEDLERLARRIRDDHPGLTVVPVSTASYAGTHAEGYRAAQLALLRLAEKATQHDGEVVVLPPLVSPADLAWLGGLLGQGGGRLLTDYGPAADGGFDGTYRGLARGGTPVAALRAAGAARAVVDCPGVLPPSQSPAAWLAREHGVPRQAAPWPLGVVATDTYLATLAAAGIAIPAAETRARARLVDACIDGHKHVAGRRVALFGDDDLVLALTGFCWEMGLEPVLAMGTGRSMRLPALLRALAPAGAASGEAIVDGDLARFAEAARRLKPDLIIGHGRGYRLSRELGVPLLRIGYPIHDRLGAGRLRMLGYDGSLELFERIANACIAHDQDASPLGWNAM